MLHCIFHFTSAFAKGSLLNGGRSIYRFANTSFVGIKLQPECCAIQWLWKFLAGREMRCCKLGRQRLPILANPLGMVHFRKNEEKIVFISRQRHVVYEWTGEHVIWIQCLNIQIKFRYPFPHLQILWYAGYRVEENTEWVKKNDGGRERALVAYRNEYLVDMYNLCTLKYSFVVWSSLEMHMLNLTFVGQCVANIFTEYNQQDATFHNLFISVTRSTCFGRVFRPSSGAQNCTYSVRYLSDQYLTLYVQFWAPGDGRKNRPKRVERVTEINCETLHLVGCTLWAYAEIGPMLISGNVSFWNMLVLCVKTNDNSLFQFLKSNFWTEIIILFGIKTLFLRAFTTGGLLLRTGFGITARFSHCEHLAYGCKLLYWISLKCGLCKNIFICSSLSLRH